VAFPVTLEGHFGGRFTVVTLYAQLTRNLLAIAKFLLIKLTTNLMKSTAQRSPLQQNI